MEWTQIIFRILLVVVISFGIGYIAKYLQIIFLGISWGAILSGYMLYTTWHDHLLDDFQTSWNVGPETAEGILGLIWLMSAVVLSAGAIWIFISLQMAITSEASQRTIYDNIAVLLTLILIVSSSTISWASFKSPLTEDGTYTDIAIRNIFSTPFSSFDISEPDSNGRQFFVITPKFDFPFIPGTEASFEHREYVFPLVSPPPEGSVFYICDNTQMSRKIKPLLLFGYDFCIFQTR